MASYLEIKQLVEKTLKTECIIEPPVLASEIAKNNGIKVYTVDFSELPHSFQVSSGFIDAETNTMYINSADNPKRRNFTIAHELGHYFLGHTQKSEYETLFRLTTKERNHSQLEKDANCFAANLLVPEQMLKKIIQKYPFITNRSLSNVFGVSEEVIYNRKNTLGLY